MSSVCGTDFSVRIRTSQPVSSVATETVVRHPRCLRVDGLTVISHKTQVRRALDFCSPRRRKRGTALTLLPCVVGESTSPSAVSTVSFPLGCGLSDPSDARRAMAGCRAMVSAGSVRPFAVCYELNKRDPFCNNPETFQWQGYLRRDNAPQRARTLLVSCRTVQRSRHHMNHKPRHRERSASSCRSSQVHHMMKEEFLSVIRDLSTQKTEPLTLGHVQSQHCVYGGPARWAPCFCTSAGSPCQQSLQAGGTPHVACAKG